MREKILKKLACWQIRHPKKVLVIVMLMTLIMAVLAGKLTMTMRTSDLLPEEDLRVQEFNQIVDEFVTATNLVVVVSGEEKQIKAFADELAPMLLTLKDSRNNRELRKKIRGIEKKTAGLKLSQRNRKKRNRLLKEMQELQRKIDKKLFIRVDYRENWDFLRKNALMMIKADDLEKSKPIFCNPNLPQLLQHVNDSLEMEYVGRAESISSREKEDKAVNMLDGIDFLLSRLNRVAAGYSGGADAAKAAADKLLLGEPYFLSYDKSTLIVSAIPNFSLVDRDYIVQAAQAARKLVDQVAARYPGVSAGLSGQIARECDEQVYSERSLSITTIIAFAAILVLLIISFRMWLAPLFSLVNLLIGLIWAMGTAKILVGQLNMFTAMMSVVLLGLGIDFSIHLIAVFTEWRAAGNSVADSLERTFMKTGKGIITGAITTACAFFALMISSSRGMKEMGLVTGAGLLTVMVVTFLFLPVMLVLREQRIERKSKKRRRPRDISFTVMGRGASWLGKHWGATILAAVLVCAVMLLLGSGIQWDYDFRNLEPEGLQSIELMDTIMEKFDLSMEYAMVLAESPEKSDRLAREFREMGTVATTSDISIYLPSEKEQKKRLPGIREIARKMSAQKIKEQLNQSDLKKMQQELGRLEMNIMEIQDMAFLGGQDKVDRKCKQIVGDPENPDQDNLMSKVIQNMSDNQKPEKGLSDFNREFAAGFRRSVLEMSGTEGIRLADLPPDISGRFANSEKNKFLVTVYPTGNIYDNKFLLRFVDDLNRISPRTTGLPSLSVALIKILGRDGGRAVLLTMLIVFMLLWLDFRHPLYALAAMIPLGCGMIWMVGLMHVLGLKLNIMNMMGIPLIIGIGIDDGVHIIHRWRGEGPGSLKTVFASTGKAVFLTSLTTMLAFGSMVFSVFPAWQSFGVTLLLGVGTCFLTSVLILPGIIGASEMFRLKKTCRLSVRHTSREVH